MERDDYIKFGKKTLDDFNSHAHVERDDFFALVSAKIIISTHTLTWSVTLYVLHGCWLTLISTHTLTWSVTPQQLYLLRPSQISTHTLTWSVTGTKS